MAIYEQRLQSDLNAINTKINDMGDMVEAAISNAVKAFLTNNIALANSTVISDNPINRKMREIDYDCHTFIARHLPSAGHLRHISAVIRLNIILERIGDYAGTISRESIQFGKVNDDLGAQIELIANEATHMLNQSLRSFYEGSADVAKVTMKLSEHMEDTMDNVYATLADNDTRMDTYNVFALFTTLGLLKRITDQSKNICEETVFSQTGETKEKKVYNILFLDEDNSRLAAMIAAIGERYFSHCGKFVTAARNPAESIHQDTLTFLSDISMPADSFRPRKVEFTGLELSQFHVIVALQGSVKSYIEKVPFHTAFVDWDFEEFPHSGSDEQQQKWYQQSYRELTHQVTELMETLYGDTKI